MATEQTLDQRYQEIRAKYRDYTEHTPLNSDHDFVKAGLIWGEDQGNQTPSVLLIALEPGHWDYWSTSVVEALETKDYLKAARLAEDEFARTHDSAALLQQLNALYRANRLFEFEEVFHREYKSDLKGSDQSLIRLLGIKTFLTLRKTRPAEDLIQNAERQDGESLELDFLRATLFGLEANFPEAREALEAINRKCPSKPQVLIRLIQVCEQMRDYSAAVGYLKHALRVANISVELEAKRQRYQALGLW